MTDHRPGIRAVLFQDSLSSGITETVTVPANQLWLVDSWWMNVLNPPTSTVIVSLLLKGQVIYNLTVNPGQPFPIQAQTLPVPVEPAETIVVSVGLDPTVIVAVFVLGVIESVIFP
jgi:hypothetical protein